MWGTAPGNTGQPSGTETPSRGSRPFLSSRTVARCDASQGMSWRFSVSIMFSPRQGSYPMRAAPESVRGSTRASPARGAGDGVGELLQALEVVAGEQDHDGPAGHPALAPHVHELLYRVPEPGPP